MIRLFENYSIPPKTYFEIASFGYLSVLYLISFYDPDRNKIRSYTLFRNLELNMLLALIVSVLTYIFAFPELGTPIPVCLILRTMDSVLCVMASRTFSIYLMEYIDTKGKVKVISFIGNILFTTYIILMILNLFFKFVLWFTPEGIYMHGPLFVPIVFSTPVYYMSSCILMLILSIRNLGVRERVSLSVASFVTLFGIIIQAATNGILLLSLPFGSIGIFVLYFSIETSDYHQLLWNIEKLRIAEQDAIKANHAKSDFLANMSHEIRTPLNAVLGMDELILLETEENNKPNPSLIDHIREYAFNIKEAGEVLLSVINDILDLTKIESGKMEISPAPYNLHTLTDNIETMMRIRAEQKGLSYIQKIDSSIPDHLIGDELRIRQIVINLLGNAVKYTDFGEVELDITMGNKDPDSLTLIFCVKDTGIGIRKEDLPHVFDAFQRIDEEHNHKIEGTGLGLSIVQRMAALMNGDVSVTSEYGKGSAFTVSIPQRIDRDYKGESSIKNSLKHSELFTFITPDARFLVVDDNRLNLVVAKRFLDGLEGTIETAKSGEEALGKMRTEKYDMIFMDHMMPGIDGIETLKLSLKDTDNLNRETPIIMMTANALSGMREEYISQGFTDYVSKPIELKELLRIVNLHLPKEKIK
ncbi:MAG: response regulator [Lachnospiraceae bacterium]|nr:response regulator [Lachnospiraceae bacterium]